MIDTNKLWRDRFHDFLQRFLGYMRFIANSGFIFSIFLLIIFGSYYYSQLIQQIPDTFPVFFVVALLFTFFLVRSPLRSFLKRADLVFLIAAEGRMKPYFTLSILYNVIIQVFVVLLVAVVVYPLYESRSNVHSELYLVFILLFSVVKIWNIGVNWFVLRLPMSRLISSYTFLRAVATFVFVYLALKGAHVIFLLALAFIMLLFMIYVSFSFSKHHGLKWERLLEMDETLLMRFYRFANSFMDVPQLKQKTKPRRWLNPLTKWIPYKQASVPLFLYVKAFLRSGDYFGIYVRLLVLGVLILMAIPANGGRFIGFFLFLCVTAVQIIPLSRHFMAHEMLKLYPVANGVEEVRYFQPFLFLLLALMGIVYSLALFVAGVSIVHVGVLLAAGMILSYAYGLFALRKQVRSQ